MPLYLYSPENTTYRSWIDYYIQAATSNGAHK